MDVEIILGLVGLLLGLITHFIIFVIFLSKLSSRVNACETNIEKLEGVHILIKDEIKTLHKIEGQLELLITHILPKN